MQNETGGTVADRKEPERGGGVRCWASPTRGWSYVQRVNQVSVSVLDNWGNGGKNFSRTIPFDKLTALMSKAEIDQARTDGRLREDALGIGFYLLDKPPEPAPNPFARGSRRARSQLPTPKPSRSYAKRRKPGSRSLPCPSFSRHRPNSPRGWSSWPRSGPATGCSNPAPAPAH
jgi:hypothetical protein